MVNLNGLPEGERGTDILGSFLAVTYVSDRFVEEIGKVFKKTDNLLIMCRDGERSTPAAKELVAAGFQKVFNVEDGFEGAEHPTDEDSNRHKYYRQLAKRHKLHSYKHRRHSGWQWWGLPWTYEIDPKYIYPPDREKPKNNTLIEPKLN